MVTLEGYERGDSFCSPTPPAPECRRQEHLWGKCLVLLCEHPLPAAAQSREDVLETMGPVGWSSNGWALLPRCHHLQGNIFNIQPSSWFEFSATVRFASEPSFFDQ